MINYAGWEYESAYENCMGCLSAYKSLQVISNGYDCACLHDEDRTVLSTTKDMRG